jgi:excisionase family DNA binding protein
MEPVFLTVEEAARVLSVSRTRIFDLIRTKRLRSRKIGRVRWIPVEPIREFVDLDDEHEVGVP